MKKAIDCPYTKGPQACESLALTYAKGPQGPQGPPYSCYRCPRGREIRKRHSVNAMDLVEFNKDGQYESSPGAADWRDPVDLAADLHDGRGNDKS